MVRVLSRLMMISACLLVTPTFAGVEIAVAQSSLKKCPNSQNQRWHNCFGKWSDGKGYTYEGEWKDDKQHGQGSYTSTNGEKYVGEFRAGNPHGQGTLTHGDGSHKGEKYVGEFRDGKLNGRGTYTFPNGEQYVGEFKDDSFNGQGTQTFPTGETYVGEFKNGQRNGQFVVTYSDGGKYVGEFKDDKFNGQGTYTFSSGEKYVGAFNDDKYNGQGTYTHPNGDKYVGEFKDDKFNGQGTYTLANREKYVGEFKDNKYNGQGTFTFSDGGKYVGEFKDDNANGQGTYTFPNGDKYVGEFKDWQTLGQFTVTYANGDSFSGSYQSQKRSGLGTYSWKDGSKYIGQWQDGLPTADGILKNSSGAVISGAQYSSAAVYDADGGMTTPDVLTYSGGTVQQQVTQTTIEQQSEQQPIVVSDNLRKVALVIGNSGYQHAAPLENPHNDAEAMTSLLKNIGFNVVSGTDLDKRATEQKIADFVDKAAQADVSLFFYAGHGIQVAGENFIVPIDAKVEKASAIDFELVNVSMVTSYMGGEKSIGIALLDACRDNPFTRSLSRALGNRSNQVNTGLAELKSGGGGLLVGFATAPGDVAADGIGMKNSPFTTALLKHLGTQGLEVELMMKRVKAEVIEMTKNQQRPWTNSDLAKEVYLAGPSDGSALTPYDSDEENTTNSNSGTKEGEPADIIAPPENKPWL